MLGVGIGILFGIFLLCSLVLCSRIVHHLRGSSPEFNPGTKIDLDIDIDVGKRV